jgi:phosphopantetheine adenylyltransferase
VAWQGINSRREKAGLPPLSLTYFPLLGSEAASDSSAVSAKLSSSDIRRRLLEGAESP